jgi:Arc/MetJ family transcription regulator
MKLATALLDCLSATRYRWCSKITLLSHMTKNVAIDNRLLEEAQRIGGQRTKKATVAAALEEYIQRRKQARILDLFGKVEFDSTYSYKKQRA